VAALRQSETTLTDISMNLQKLGAMSGKIRETAAAYDDTLKAEIERLAIPAGAFPVFNGGSDAAYKIMHTAAGDAAKALTDALTDVGTALQRVVDHYTDMEERHGRGFDTAVP